MADDNYVPMKPCPCCLNDGNGRWPEGSLYCGLVGLADGVVAGCGRCGFQVRVPYVPRTGHPELQARIDEAKRRWNHVPRPEVGYQVEVGK